MKRTIASIIAMLIVLSCSSAIAETQIFIKEYTYQGTEIDNKESCQIIALEQAKRLLLEEVGTYLESETVVRDYQLTKDQITTLTAGIVQTNIVDEHWDRKSYWVKARIVVETSEVAKSIDNLRRDRQKTKELEEIRKRAEEALKETERLKNELQIAKADRRKIEILYNVSVRNLSATQWVEQGFRLLQVGILAEAMEAFTKAIDLDPNFTLAYFYRGLILNFVGKKGEAVEEFNKAIELTAEDNRYTLPLLYIRRGTSYEEMGDHKKAIEDFNRIIRKKPETAIDFARRGDAYYKLGNQYKAIEDYTKAIELEPWGESGYEGRGDAYKKLGNNRQAIDDYTKAIELSMPALSVNTLNKRRLAYGELGDQYKARRDFERSIQLQPDSALPFIGYALTYSLEGDLLHLKGGPGPDRRMAAAIQHVQTA